MLHRLPYGQGVDWWALGIMIYAMLTGRLPFYHVNTIALEYYIKNSAVSYPEGISREAESIMKMVSFINIKTGIESAVVDCGCSSF